MGHKRSFSWLVWFYLGMAAAASGLLLRTHGNDLMITVLWFFIVLGGVVGAFRAGLEYQRGREWPEHA